MNADATTPDPRKAGARRYSEQVHVLVDETTRAYLLGLAVLAAQAGGYSRPKEGEEVRDLLDEAISRRFADNARLWRKAVNAGQKEMIRRSADRAQAA